MVLARCCSRNIKPAGRGRRGRAWLAPPGGSICLSLSWTFREVPADLSALGLVVGVCKLRALRELGIAAAKLKWPNDILVDDRKLGGILIELRAESDGPVYVVIGIGLNVAPGRTSADEDRGDRDRGDGSHDGRIVSAVSQRRRRRCRGFVHSWPVGFRARGAQALH